MLVRRIEGLRGRMRLRCALALRFDYGLVRPRVRRQDDVLLAIAGPDMLAMRASVALECSDDGCLGAEFAVDAGQTLTFVMSYGPSHCPPPGRSTLKGNK